MLEIPRVSQQAVPSEPSVLLDGSPLLKLLPSEDLGSPGGGKGTKPEASRHVCCEGPLGEIKKGGIEPNTLYRTVDKSL